MSQQCGYRHPQVPLQVKLEGCIPEVEASGAPSCSSAGCRGRTLKYTFCRDSSMRACATLPVLTRSRNSEYTTCAGRVQSQSGRIPSNMLKPQHPAFNEMSMKQDSPDML